MALGELKWRAVRVELGLAVGQAEGRRLSGIGVLKGPCWLEMLSSDHRGLDLAEYTAPHVEKSSVPTLVSRRYGCPSRGRSAPAFVHQR